MNHSISQAEVQNQLTSEIIPATDNATHIKKQTAEYTADSLWSNLRYLLVMLAVMIIPSFIPNVTTRSLIMTYAGSVLAIYVVAFIIRLVIELQPDKEHRTRIH